MGLMYIFSYYEEEQTLRKLINSNEVNGESACGECKQTLPNPAGKIFPEFTRPTNSSGG